MGRAESLFRPIRSKFSCWFFHVSIFDFRHQALGVKS